MSEWTGTDQALPNEREHVRFVVAGHRTWLLGTFEANSFRSRWAAYAPGEVSAWRKLSDAALFRAPLQAPPEMRSWSERPMRSASD